MSMILPFSILFMSIFLDGFCQDSDSLFYKEFLPVIEKESMKKRIIFVKSQTDKYLLHSYSKHTREKFWFAFPGCTFGINLPHGRGRTHYFPSFRSEADTNVVEVIHNYQFYDQSINLKVEHIDVYYDDQDGIKLYFYSLKDSLTNEALKKIYNKGYFEKIVKKIRESKFKNYLTEIKVNERTHTYDLIVKDKNLPHQYFLP